MSHVDDLVQPGPEQIVRACRPVLLWSHRSLRCSTESRFAAAGKSKIEIAGFCCEAPIPCNLKCRRNRKTDSQSSAWRLVHGQLVRIRTIEPWNLTGTPNPALTSPTRSFAAERGPDPTRRHSNRGPVHHIVLQLKGDAVNREGLYSSMSAG
ncbi:blr1975 [Bradyrhizobium diazoefficiens USDA 110]|uniref:Blr1975 protein n=2 Tax=Bradyrhizobium TaxID=374 RepID=Q89TH9_BRADU|nr:hypothetical protein CIT37_03170 [Bradyrhizobium ottawaense]QBP20816.1 hypothetical protein Bdiaspc4_10025 [Bradyrhizobium diazoefficiens]BAC47240.1 blr1975 [Bradyrhizobium diazoefficiens USDA 110]